MEGHKDTGERGRRPWAARYNAVFPWKWISSYRVNFLKLIFADIMAGLARPKVKYRLPSAPCFHELCPLCVVGARLPFGTSGIMIINYQ